MHMPGEKNLNLLIKSMKPRLHPGQYVFCTVQDLHGIHLEEIILYFKEEEAITIILGKETADRWHLPYSFISRWITLTVHSSLEAVGLTAAFSSALSKKDISCNVVAANYHDHIFVGEKDAEKAMSVLLELSN